jgi:sugar/nucleoside kinase (ribokinase family)
MSRGRWEVVGIGENSMDVVYRLTGPLPVHGKAPIASRRVLPGGQVATTLCACSALGLRTRYFGTFGNDDHAQLIRGALEAYGVDTGAALVRQAPNRHALILVDEAGGDRTVLWQRDPALALGAADLPSDLLTGARLLHVDATDEEASLAAAGVARSAGLEVTTDIDHVTARTGDLVAAATLPILAEHVPGALTGEHDPERALRALRARHGGMLCVTLGARGALLLDGDRLHRAPALTVNAVDTTGAGDVFRGALIYSLLRGDPPDMMLRFANAAAAVSCTREGAIGGVPTLAEVEAMEGAETGGGGS